MSLTLNGFSQAQENHEKLRQGMMAADATLANEAVSACAVKGTDFLPTLRKWAATDDPRLRLRARSAIGRVTGQWGSQTDLVWQRDFPKAISDATAAAKQSPGKLGKPIMLLQLFGSLNEEYC